MTTTTLLSIIIFLGALAGVLLVFSLVVLLAHKAFGDEYDPENERSRYHNHKD